MSFYVNNSGTDTASNKNLTSGNAEKLIRSCCMFVRSEVHDRPRYYISPSFRPDVDLKATALHTVCMDANFKNTL